MKDIVDCDVGFGIVAATTQAPRIYLLLTPSTVTVESEFLRHPSNSERVRGTQKLPFFSMWFSQDSCWIFLRQLRFTYTFLLLGLGRSSANKAAAVRTSIPTVRTKVGAELFSPFS